jgi:hypothetical protein
MTAPTGVSTQETAGSTRAAATPATDASPAVPSGPPAALDAKAVATWLSQHPAFFHDHPELLLELSIPHDSGRAISLLERQVAVFRERQGSLQDQIHEFIGNARANDDLFEKTRLLVLELLRCSTLESLQALIAGKLLAEFDASASELVFVADEPAPAEAGFRRLSTSDVRTALGDLFAKQRAWCGALDTAQQHLLFGERSPAIVSAAIVPLHLPEGARIPRTHGLPLLLIGSTEELHFNGSLDTLFLDFIGEVLAAHLQNLAAAS